MNEAVEILKSEVQRLIDEHKSCPSWRDVRGVDFVTFEFFEETDWTNIYLYVFKKGADLGGLLIGDAKTEYQENDGPDEWEVVELEAIPTTTYVVKS